ncbi:MAG: hypothetical protein ACE5JZ_00070 [Kiloniellales bacterium]
MVREDPVNGTRDSRQSHLTTRRGFVTGLGFGVVSLYGLWAAYGAAPTSLKFLSGAASGGMGAAGHGHGGHGGGGMSREEFNRLADEFFEANALPDGSVKPVRRRVAAISGQAHEGHADEPEMSAAKEHEHGHEAEAHDRGAREPRMSMAEEHEHGPEAEAHEHGAAPPSMSMAEEHEHGDEEGPIEVYVRASRYGYEPDVLRLEPNIPYKFRMMAVDADHGVSISMRMGSHMMRCRARVLTEAILMFTAPGEYLCYCTVYCGEGHDMMMGTIVVA